ncbi:MAG: TerC/Alx family metal homeostasis membrane protein [Bacteroidota bacterium]
MNSSELLYFSLFILFVLVALLLDLGLFNKHDKIIRPRQAMVKTVVWVSLALLFYLFLNLFGENIHGISTIETLKMHVAKYGQSVAILDNDYAQSINNYRHELSLEFITGYLIEEALSMDNLFVIILIFTAFGVEKRLYHRVLFWGILGAIVFRCLFIFTGAILVTKFEWILYLFAAFLVFTGIRMFVNRNEEEKVETENHPVVRFASKYFSIHKHFEGNKFFVRINKKNLITPLFLVLLIIEFTDILFAVDSIPAIFAVTKDPYIVFFSNIFAILGLRSLFFLLINIIHKFHFFKHGLSVLLVFIGVKMVLNDWLKTIGFTIEYSLLVIALIFALSILLSLLIPEKKHHR